MKNIAVFIAISTLAFSLKAQDAATDTASPNIVIRQPVLPTPPSSTSFTSASNILAGIGEAPATVAKDGYAAFSKFSITNPLAAHVFGLQNGKGNYGCGLEVNQADPNQLVNVGFAVA